MKNLLITTGVFVVVFLLAGTDLWPCHTHAATLKDHDGDATLLEIVQENELSRQKRQFVTGRKSRVAPVPSAPFNSEYLEKSRMIFHAHQILYGPLLELHGMIPNIRHDVTFDLGQILKDLMSPPKFNVNNLPQNLKTNFPASTVFDQFLYMRNEVCHQSYSVACFDSDRTVLIAVAKYLDGVNSGTSSSSSSSSGGFGGSWQRSRVTASPNIRNRQTLELAIALALGYGGRGSSISSSFSNNNQCTKSPSVTTGSSSTRLIG